MAKLYRGVLGLPHRRGLIGGSARGPRAYALGAAAALAALVVAAPAAGQAVTAAQLGRAAEDLGAEEGSARQRAWRWLSGLGEAALPAIRERIDQLEGQRLEAEAARDALYAFRHAVGSRRGDDMVDIAPGVLPVLEARRDAVAVGMAERLALARSLEGLGTLEAGRALCDLLGIEDRPWPWKWESRRIVDRMGIRALPILLVAGGHDSRFVRRWARRGGGDLGLDEPGQAVQRASEAGLGTLADLLRAYGEARIMDAMPVVVAFVGDERHRVREAARAAVEDYGRNIIWQLRRAYRVETGRDAERSWGVEDLRRKLYAHLDAARLAPVRGSLERGLAALGTGKLETMERHFDRVLRDAPGEPRLERAMAEGWAELGDARLEAGQYASAVRAYRRALASGGAEAAQGRRWRARLTLAQAEASLSAGVADLPAYEAALELDPGLDSAAAAVDSLSGDAAERARTRRRWASALGALLLAFVALTLLRPKPADDEETPEDTDGAEGSIRGV